MGNEADCTMIAGKQKASGKALLETSEIIFRPRDGSPRVKIAFATVKSATASDGELRLVTREGAFSFSLGAAAAKWREKILHPKTRIEKLGVKPGVTVTLLGEFDEDFNKELRTATKTVSAGKDGADSDLIFLSVSKRSDLGSLTKTANLLKGAAALWVVYPKGKQDITEGDVLSAGRKAALKDVKVVSFSPTHTALKFVIPVAKR